jgi:hypothetical protein
LLLQRFFGRVLGDFLSVVKALNFGHVFFDADARNTALNKRLKDPPNALGDT